VGGYIKDVFWGSAKPDPVTTPWLPDDQVPVMGVVLCAASYEICASTVDAVASSSVSTWARTINIVVVGVVVRAGHYGWRNGAIFG